MKNLLWIFHKPIDEREEQIYARAYRKMFLALLFVVYMLVAPPWIVTFNNDRDFNAQIPLGFIFQALAIGGLVVFLSVYLIGWLTLRNEEIDLSNLKKEKRFKDYLSRVLPLILLATQRIWIPYYWGKYMLWVGIVELVLFQFVLTIVAIWIFRGKSSSRNWFGIIFIPAWLLLHHRVGHKVFSTKVFVLIAPIFIYTILISFTVFSPLDISVSTIKVPDNTFAPNMVAGQLVTVDDMESNYKIGDFVKYWISDGVHQDIIGQVVRLDEKEMEIKTALGNITTKSFQRGSRKGYVYVFGKLTPGKTRWDILLHPGQ